MCVWLFVRMFFGCIWCLMKGKPEKFCCVIAKDNVLCNIVKKKCFKYESQNIIFHCQTKKPIPSHVDRKKPVKERTMLKRETVWSRLYSIMAATWNRLTASRAESIKADGCNWKIGEDFPSSFPPASHRRPSSTPTRPHPRQPEPYSRHHDPPSRQLKPHPCHDDLHPCQPEPHPRQLERYPRQCDPHPCQPKPHPRQDNPHPRQPKPHAKMTYVYFKTTHIRAKTTYIPYVPGWPSSTAWALGNSIHAKPTLVHANMTLIHAFATPCFTSIFHICFSIVLQHAWTSTWPLLLPGL